ncbi:nuclear transport factor 2 family protein [Bradyrhizobium cenepequi]
MQSRHRVEEFISAYNRKDVPGALACFTDDASYQDVTYGTHSGQAELKKMLERMFLDADACWKVHTWVADTGRVAIEWTIDSQITAAVPQSAGKRVRLFAMGLFEFRDGKSPAIANIWISVRFSCNSVCRRKLCIGRCRKNLRAH